jgi:hypothetical protein
LLVRLPEYHFIHGTAFMEGKLTAVIYFEDAHIGLIALSWSLTETKFSRFRGSSLPRTPSTTPSVN